MRKKWWIVAAPLGLLIFIAIGGEVVMQLWNWLAPSVFGLRQITFWQAIGLLALCRILFGSLGGCGSHRSNSRRRMAEWSRASGGSASASGGLSPEPPSDSK